MQSLPISNQIDPSLDEKLAQACSSAVPDPGNEALINSLNHASSSYNFKNALSRGGWYRLGGVVDNQGNKIANHIESWLETDFDNELGKVIQHCSQKDYYVTRLQGQTHYLVCSTGPAASDFLQLEVEEIQEVYDRPLINLSDPPETVADIIDPATEVEGMDAKTIGSPRYRYRRLSVIPEVLDRARKVNEVDKSTIERFFWAWDNSSAGEHEKFCQNWILTIHEYTDPYGNYKISVKPKNTKSKQTKPIQLTATTRGANLANSIHSFDRRLGYPMAWFFCMITEKSVPFEIVNLIHDDLMGVYQYLPQRDLKILVDWYDDPYSL